VAAEPVAAAVIAEQDEVCSGRNTAKTAASTRVIWRGEIRRDDFGRVADRRKMCTVGVCV
jgi:hypothetical protein